MEEDKQQLLRELCHIIFVRNKLNAARVAAMSRAAYYRNIDYVLNKCKWIDGVIEEEEAKKRRVSLKKWSKVPKKELRAKILNSKADVLIARRDMLLFSSAHPTHKLLRKLNATTLVNRMNRVVEIHVRHHVDSLKGYMVVHFDEKEIEHRHLMYEADQKMDAMIRGD